MFTSPERLPKELTPYPVQFLSQNHLFQAGGPEGIPKTRNICLILKRAKWLPVGQGYKMGNTVGSRATQRKRTSKCSQHLNQSKKGHLSFPRRHPANQFGERNDEYPGNVFQKVAHSEAVSPSKNSNVGWVNPQKMVRGLLVTPQINRKDANKNKLLVGLLFGALNSTLAKDA